MEYSRPFYLVSKLLNNQLSKEEFEEMLLGLGREEMTPEYSAALESYFQTIMAEQELQTSKILI